MADVQSEINKIASAVYGRDVRSSIVSGLTKVNQEASNAQTLANQVKTSDTNQNTRISSLETDNTTNKSNINSLGTRMNTAESKITSHGTKISTLESTTATHTSDISTINNNITAIDTLNTAQSTRLDALETKDTAHEERMATIEGSITAIQEGDTARDEAITALEESIETTVEESLTSINETIETIQNDVSANATSIRSHGDRLDALETGHQNTQNALNAMRTDVADAADAAAVAYEALENIESRLSTVESKIDTKVDDGELDDEGNFYLTSEGSRVAGPFTGFSGSGGGGGGSVIASTLTVNNASGWASKTVSGDSDVLFTFTWTSIADELPTGDGTLKVIVNGATAGVLNIQQGNCIINLKPYIGAGVNTCKLVVTDQYGASKPMIITITVIDLIMESSFDASSPFNDSIAFTYTPYGSVEKTVHILVDGVEVGTKVVKTSGRQQTYYISQQSHGAHSIEAYCTADVNGSEIESNHIYFDIICLQPGNYDVIIAVNFNQTTIQQYNMVMVKYNVYDPDSMTSDVDLLINGTVVKEVNVDRSEQTWSFMANDAGDMTMSIRCGDVMRTFNLTVEEVEIDAAMETNDLRYYFSAVGRSNQEADPAVWTSGDITTTFTNFNWINNGWITLEDGSTVLRLNGDARATINDTPVSFDPRVTGATYEFDFCTRDVRDYDAVLISCMSGNRGFVITPQQIIYKSAQSTIKKDFSDEDHWRIAIVINKRSEQRMIYIFINGTCEGCIQYPETDDFEQVNPVAISIGSNDAGIDIYSLTCYANSLTRYQVLDNWIVDCQNGAEMLDRYSRNDIYDAYGEVVINKLPTTLPYFIAELENLPAIKEDNFESSGSFTYPSNTSRNFTYDGGYFKVQGTSSLAYDVKNFKVKFNNGFYMSNGLVSKYPLRPGAMAVKLFCFKADVASSEGVNNTELVRLYNDICPYKTPPQVLDSTVRQGIDGFPMVLFHRNSDGTKFVGKYNFNNDKGTPEVYGLTEGTQSWETRNNTSNGALFKEFNDDTWTNDFEARYPEDNENIADLKTFITTVAGWTNPTKADVEAIAEIDDALFYWIFTETFTMVDSRGKNAFPTLFTEGKWVWLPYDFDTAIGINNEGQYVFDYSVETGDIIDGANLFNAEGHKFWATIKSLYSSELKNMYKTLRSRADGKFSADYVIRAFEEHQSTWPEAIFNEDAWCKYFKPLFDRNNAAYLTMAQGTKRSVYKRWLKNRFKYMDSKYNCADNVSNAITVRGYAKNDLTITPYSDIYVNVKYGSALVSTRANRNQAYTMACPLDQVNDTETFIYGADMIKKIDGLPGYMVGWADFSKATKLEEIILGSAESGYDNQKLKMLHLGNLSLLKKIDCRNCTQLGTGEMATIDASGCLNIEEIYLENTAVTGVSVPNGGELKIMHLPNTITELTLRNQKLLEDLTIAEGASIQSMWLENMNDAIDCDELISDLEEGARLRYVGFYKEASSISEISVYMDIWDNYRGLDENGNTTDTAQISGTFHIDSATGNEVAALRERYPYVSIVADHLTCHLYYMSEDGSTLIYDETVADGGDGTYSGTPSKSSTAQYTYSFAGWSKTPGGSVWSDAKKAVTSDRYVYAAFTATVRTYTVYFYNGSTLLETVKNVPYGGSATYSGDTSELVDPSGNAQPFGYWSPSPNNITGNVSSYACFYPPIEESITDSWETIISNIENASSGAECGYSLGDTKVVDFGSDCGPLAMQLVAFDTDNLSDGSGKAKTSWVSRELGRTLKPFNPSLVTNYDEITTAGWGPTETANEYQSLITGMADKWVNAYAYFTITAETEGTLRIYHHMKDCSYPYVQLSVTVGDNSSVSGKSIKGYSSPTASIDLAQGESVQVTVKMSRPDSCNDDCFVKFASTGDIIISENIPDVTYKPITGYQLGTGTIGGWRHSELRAYVRGLKENISDSLKESVKEVSKYSNGYTEDLSNKGQFSARYDETTTDDLWVPCYKELTDESAEVTYAGFFTTSEPSSNKRPLLIKYQVGSSKSIEWRTRYSSGTKHCCKITDEGAPTFVVVDSGFGRGVCIGFCI